MKAGILTTMLAMGGLALATPDAAMAQQAVPEQQQQQVEVTEDLLDRFVAVYPSVVEVAQTAQAELGAAETPEEAQAIQANAQASITTILEEGGMTVPEYEAVVMRLNDDPELMAAVEARLMEQAEEDDTQR